MKCVIAGSIVLYNNDSETLRKAIESFLDTELNVRLYLIDNSTSNSLKKLKTLDDRIEYVHNNANIGFGAAHNIAIKSAIDMGAKYHFVINPDIFFYGNVIETMIAFIEMDSSVGMLMPQILYPDGSIQYLPKLLPSPIQIIWRKIGMPKTAFRKFIDLYELRKVPQKQICNVPVLSGCFSLLNLNAIKEVGLYDDTFFMYFEDWDLSRRVHQKYKTLYFPLVSVYHEYERGANKSFRLFKIFIKSAFSYYKKWGFFIDKERHKINKKTLEQFN
ncbi:glycosyl transferase family 2 [Emticicia aquatilis]|uniref:Glycosyl transferase family 2 n=1 Tax=Emticicia aquatilis TaxID=1537369 RepID=A0A917DRM9_9BACT|nr:glycosyltransferase [Emticicia aquatilis]GGD64499.1 glycosyl transferase family 2 [Emticicia aquatilis]